MDENNQGLPPLNGGPPPGVEPRTLGSQAEDNPYGIEPSGSQAGRVETPTQTAVTVAPRPSGGMVRTPPPPPPPSEPEEDPDDEGMLRMSFMDHLEELRKRIIRALYGLGIAFIFSMLYSYKLWDIIQEPATTALKHLGVIPPKLTMTQPMEGFSIIWVKLPLLCSVFIAAPWIIYQAWSFIAPGLYQRERRWAIPGILSTAGLFIGGGLFAYFLAFRYGLEFLLGIGMSNGVQPIVTITEYFDLFVDVTLGVGLVFEMPVLIFFLTLIRLASPRFLMRHSRYAILAIVIIAAIVTPTPDVFNLMLFAVPMTLLYFVGVFAGYLIVLRREGQSFPWGKVLPYVFGVLAIAGGVVYVMVARYGFKLIPHWPFLTK